ncbi:hypothetical protein X750_23245 [Mesorhizobium sp. LNJC394B00]|nr:hypothetical protein X750_23245 [Mesorhizobium sp. LNJC394B00]
MPPIFTVEEPDFRLLENEVSGYGIGIGPAGGDGGDMQTSGNRAIDLFMPFSAAISHVPAKTFFVMSVLP